MIEQITTIISNLIIITINLFEIFLQDGRSTWNNFQRTHHAWQSGRTADEIVQAFYAFYDNDAVLEISQNFLNLI